MGQYAPSDIANGTLERWDGVVWLSGQGVRQFTLVLECVGMLFLQLFTDSFNEALDRLRDAGLIKWGYYGPPA